MTCENRNAAFYRPGELAFSPCVAEATKAKKVWRIGDRSKGEESVVYYEKQLCEICSNLFDRTIGLDSDDDPEEVEVEKEEKENVQPTATANAATIDDANDDYSEAILAHFTGPVN